MDSTPLPPPSSFHPTVGHSPTTEELNRKRKLLQYELGNSGLPWPKHKIHDRLCSSVKESVASELTDHVTESENDHDKFTGDVHSKLTCETSSGTKEFSTESFLQDQHGVSSSSSATSLSRDALYSLESRSTKDVNNKDHEHTVHPGYRCTEDKCAVWGYDELDYTKNDLEMEDDQLADDAALYSNGVAPFFLEPERWEVGKGTRKPTIDQEFEEYFSGLML